MDKEQSLNEFKKELEDIKSKTKKNLYISEFRVSKFIREDKTTFYLSWSFGFILKDLNTLRKHTRQLFLNRETTNKIIDYINTLNEEAQEEYIKYISNNVIIWKL